MLGTEVFRTINMPPTGEAIREWTEGDILRNSDRKQKESGWDIGRETLGEAGSSIGGDEGGRKLGTLHSLHLEGRRRTEKWSTNVDRCERATL